MSKEKVIDFLKKEGLYEGYVEMDESTSTVELAAAAIGIEPGRVAKTLSLKLGDDAIVILVRGDARIDNKKYKSFFGKKAKFLSVDEVEQITGHPVGGVCPFALKEGVKIYLDESLKDFDPVYPAAGSPHNAVRISLSDLYRVTGEPEWIDVCQ